MKFKMNNSDWEIKEISNAEMNILISSDKQETFTHGTTQYDCNTIFINEETPNKKNTLYHELTHCFMYEYGHNQWQKEFNNEDVCEIVASSHDIIHDIVEEYFSPKIDITAPFVLTPDKLEILTAGKDIGVEKAIWKR